MNSGIYKIRNIINNKVYIGSSINLKQRWRNHKYYLKNNKHDNFHLCNAFNKYGESNFQFEIIETILLKEKNYIEQREQFWIDYYQSNDERFGYNSRIKVNNNFGWKHSEETKQKIRKTKLGEKNHNYGKPMSEEQKRKISKSNEGKIRTEETRKRISKSHIGIRKGMYGKHHSIKSKQKMSNSHIGKHHSKETKQRMINAHKKGENHPLSKMTWKQVKEIRNKYIPRKYSLLKLSKEYNVSLTTIHNIINNKIWKENE